MAHEEDDATVGQSRQLTQQIVDRQAAQVKEFDILLPCEGVPGGLLHLLLDVSRPDYDHHLPGTRQQFTDRLKRSAEIKSKGNAGHRGAGRQPLAEGFANATVHDRCVREEIAAILGDKLCSRVANRNHGVKLGLAVLQAKKPKTFLLVFLVGQPRKVEELGMDDHYVAGLGLKRGANPTIPRCVDWHQMTETVEDQDVPGRGIDFGLPLAPGFRNQHDLAHEQGKQQPV